MMSSENLEGGVMVGKAERWSGRRSDGRECGRFGGQSNIH